MAYLWALKVGDWKLLAGSANCKKRQAVIDMCLLNPN